MVNFRINVLGRALPILAAACIFAAACQKTSDLNFPGRHPAAVIANGQTHVIYVDHATRRLMHRGGGASPTAVSPAGDEVDVRGENAPLLSSRADGALLVVYPVKTGVKKGKGNHQHTISELRAQVSRDGGKTWTSPKRIDGDDAPRGHNFADLASRPNGDVVVSWLDSRAGKQGVQATVLRSDLSVSPAQTVDPLTCQCCRTALFTSSRGDVWLAYRDLAEDKVRNMAYAVSGPGQPFEPRGDVADDRWSVNGCPESGPRFAETSDGAVWMAWFNGGANSIETASATARGPFVRRGAAVRGAANHPDLGTLPDGRLVLVYESLRDGKRSIEARTSDAAHARWSDAVVLAAEGAAPRYVRSGDRALLTYSSLADGVPHVHVMDPLPLIVGESR